MPNATISAAGSYQNVIVVPDSPPSPTGANHELPSDALDALTCPDVQAPADHLLANVPEEPRRDFAFKCPSAHVLPAVHVIERLAHKAMVARYHAEGPLAFHPMDEHATKLASLVRDLTLPPLKRAKLMGQSSVDGAIGFTFGLTFGPSGVPYVTPAPPQAIELIKLVSTQLRRLNPHIRFVGLQVIGGARSQFHVDINNVTISCAISVGAFQGGILWHTTDGTIQLAAFARCHFQSPWHSHHRLQVIETAAVALPSVCH